tara:strand:+ start:1284 stop:2225 length:942 start_codon:yes stop_codon:yes gene_type:complete
MSLNVSALADFNNQIAGELLLKLVYGGSTIEYVTVQEGVKYLEPINLFEVSLYINNGTCVSTPSGSAEFTQRNIQVCPRTSFDALCLKDLDTKYLGISSLDRGSYNETWALTNAYSELLVNQFQQANDYFLWQQASGSASTYGGTCEVSGLNYIITGSTAGVVVPNDATGSFTSATALGIMDALIENLNADVANRDDLTIFMSVTNFRKYVTGLRTANNFYFDPASVTNRGGLLEMQYPFQNVKVVGTVGLQGSNRIVCGPAKQIVVGTDLLSDFSEFQLWYDINTDTLRHRISTKLGVNIGFPEFWSTNNLA